MYLEAAEIEDLVGAHEASSLWALPARFCDQHPGEVLRASADAAGATPRLLYAFARKYAAGGRPWFALHQDEAALTVNVALSSDAAVEGGRLVALCGGAVRAVGPRAEGEATVHTSSLVHGVSRVRGGGARYSLILFWALA